MSDRIYFQREGRRIRVFNRTFDGIEGSRHYPVSTIDSRHEAEVLIMSLTNLMEEIFPPKRCPLWQHELHNGGDNVGRKS